jgi:hypothetical protein
MNRPARARRPVTDDEFDAHFDELVDCAVRLNLSANHLAVIVLWYHAARRAYETGSLEQIAKLFGAGAPLSRQVGRLLADVFKPCKLTQKSRGGKRKMFASAAAQYALAEDALQRVRRGELKLISELSAKEVRTGIAGTKFRLKMDDRSARVKDAEARRHMSPQERIAAIYKLEIDKFAEWLTGKTGASRRHRSQKNG